MRIKYSTSIATWKRPAIIYPWKDWNNRESTNRIPPPCSSSWAQPTKYSLWPDQREPNSLRPETIYAHKVDDNLNSLQPPHQEAATWLPRWLIVRKANWLRKDWRQSSLWFYSEDEWERDWIKFSNLREIFQGDLNRKIMEGILSRDFMDRPCIHT